MRIVHVVSTYPPYRGGQGNVAHEVAERTRAGGHEVAVVTHCVNRGLGAALGTGIAAALAADAEAIVTLDADGQHDSTDIAALVAPIAAGVADVAIGVRFQTGAAPARRRLANVTANLFTRVLFGVRCRDTQSGFRCLSRYAAQQIDIRTNRMEVSSEILAEAARHELRIAEVPIRTIYTEYSLSKGQNLAVGVRTAWALFLRWWV